MAQRGEGAEPEGGLEAGLLGIPQSLKPNQTDTNQKRPGNFFYVQRCTDAGISSSVLLGFFTARLWGPLHASILASVITSYGGFFA
jgi:hypothetical protein